MTTEHVHSGVSRSVQAHLARLAAENPRLNAIVVDRAAEAAVDAARMDRALAAGRLAGPLAGVVFTVKDVIATRDLPTTCGSRLLDGHPTGGDAPAVLRMRAAGAILVGKTNCPEFALGVHTDNSRYGRTHNPLGSFTVGGSSGGEAAAVAAGMSSVGLGTDFGGSIRWPAQCTGLVGLRPTIGRVPATGQFPSLAGPPDPGTLQGLTQVIGPISRRVADVEAALAALAGPDPANPLTRPAPLGDSGAVRLDRVELRWDSRVAGVAASREIEDALDWATGELTRAGVTTSRGLPSTVDAASDLYTGLRAADPMETIADLARGRETLLDARTRAILDARVPAGEPDLRAMWAARERLVAELVGWLRGARLLALPVSVRPPFLPPEAAGGPTEFDVLLPCQAVSFFGLPAISVPAPRTAGGIPVSVQLVAPPFREDLLFRAARLIEQHRDVEQEERPCGYR